MRRIVTAILAAGVVALAVGATAGTTAPPRPVVGILKAAADYVGLTPEQLVSELKAGKSLAQVATANGKTVAGLKAALTDAVEAGLDKAVADDKLSADKAKEALARFEQNLDRLVNAQGPPPRRKHARPFAAVLKAAADYLGVAPLELARELRGSGKSLGQAAIDHGKTVAGLKAALHDAVEAGLAKAVENGRLSADKAKEALAKFDENLDRLVNRAGPRS